MTPDRIVAWRVTANGFSDTVIYAAATGGRARFLASEAIRNAGYTIACVELTAQRAPEFDGWVAKQGQERGWDEAYARRCLDEDETRLGPGHGIKGP
jgi:hypothetical protein